MDLEQFVSFLFSRPDDHHEWYFAEDFVEPNIGAPEAVELSGRVFSQIEMYANRFTEAQLSLGLNYLINPSCSSLSYAFLQPSVNEAARIGAIASMYSVFEHVFSKVASEIPSHKVRMPPHSFSYICYMWWEVFPRHGIPSQRVLEDTDEAILDNLKRILLLNSIACKESALHGLGHWYAAKPNFVEKTIDAVSSEIPVQLRRFAANARIGAVQ